MRTRKASLVLAIAALLCGGCKGKAPPPPPPASTEPAATTEKAATATASASAVAIASADAASAAAADPNCCKHVKVGQRYVFHMFPDMTDERRIEEITPTEIAFNSKLTTPGPVVLSEKKTRWNLAERSDMSSAKPGIERKQVGTETIKISGQAFECKVFEGNDGPAHFKEWLSPKFPFRIKMSVDHERSLELTAIK